MTNVELPPLCSSKLRPGPPSDLAQVTSTIVSDIINNSKFVDLKYLCIAQGKLAWVVYCDLICINNDGSLVDACIIALLASLKTCKYIDKTMCNRIQVKYQEEQHVLTQP